MIQVLIGVFLFLCGVILGFLLAHRNLNWIELNYKNTIGVRYSLFTSFDKTVKPQIVEAATFLKVNNCMPDTIEDLERLVFDDDDEE